MPLSCLPDRSPSRGADHRVGTFYFIVEACGARHCERLLMDSWSTRDASGPLTMVGATMITLLLKSELRLSFTMQPSSVTLPAARLSTGHIPHPLLRSPGNGNRAYCGCAASGAVAAIFWWELLARAGCGTKTNCSAVGEER